jgi:hypothetical protein
MSHEAQPVQLQRDLASPDHRCLLLLLRSLLRHTNGLKPRLLCVCCAPQHAIMPLPPAAAAAAAILLGLI